MLWLTYYDRGEKVEREFTMEPDRARQIGRQLQQFADNADSY